LKVLFADNGRILGCGHEICFGEILLHLTNVSLIRFIDCCLNLKNSPFDHNGILWVNLMVLIPTIPLWLHPAVMVPRNRTKQLRRPSKWHKLRDGVLVRLLSMFAIIILTFTC
jgi:hypothetical protein